MIMTAILLLAVFFISVFYITLPLFSQSPDPEENTAVEQVDRETIFLTLNELEFDYRSGKLSKSDYESLTSKYKLLATGVLKGEVENLLNDNNFSSGTNNKGILEKIESETDREIADLLNSVQSEDK